MRFNRRHVLTVAVTAGLALAPSAMGGAVSLPVNTYVAGGTAVVHSSLAPTLVDEGVVTCSASSGSGVGGTCVPFGAGNSILTNDAIFGRDIAFQACIDNDGDGICTFPNRTANDGFGCTDQVYFSHDDQERFFNPLGPLPTGFAPGCPGGAFHGYIVFICEGLHQTFAGSLTAPDAHPEPSSTGTVQLTTGGVGTAGTPFGIGAFCGGSGPENPSQKPYVVLP